MSGQSDFGRLFRRSAIRPPEPIENYLSESLAIAIEHDYRPMRSALKLVEWPGQSHAFDPDQVRGIAPRTQQLLSPAKSAGGHEGEGPGRGYLDLVLDLKLNDGVTRTTWVEVKAETGEHGEQLDDYAEHASQRPPAPAIFTLSKHDIRQAKHLTKGIGWLKWRSLARAIEKSEADVDGRWDDLLTFLGEEGLAWRSLSPDLKEPDAHVEVLIEVNTQIKARWSWAGIVWPPGALRNTALREFNDNGRMMVTAGPLTYGLVPAKEGWLWAITVGCDNYQGVRLNHVEMRRQADHARLSDRWERSTTRSAVLSLRAPLREHVAREDAGAWFAAALDELEAHGVMTSFLEGRAVQVKSQASRGLVGNVSKPDENAKEQEAPIPAPVPFPADVREFVESTNWTFAKTYAATWPHEYVVRTPENAPMILALARHIFEHGVDGRFYAQVRKYHHEGGRVYWTMDNSAETTELVNRCDEGQTWEARLAAGTLPNRRGESPSS